MVSQASGAKHIELRLCNEIRLVTSFVASDPRADQQLCCLPQNRDTPWISRKIVLRPADEAASPPLPILLQGWTGTGGALAIGFDKPEGERSS